MDKALAVEVIEWCARARAKLALRLLPLETEGVHIGTHGRDIIRWEDITQQEIATLQAEIAELTDLIARCSIGANL
jgi:peptidoglycan/xylan/chitin deacetylase (PgdA/CDA1 family)